MKRDVNFLLFGLLILLLIAMVAMAIYAQYEYQRCNTDYLTALEDIEEKNSQLNKKIAEINKTREELKSKERALVDIIKELNLSEQREVSLSGLFEDIKGEKELLEEDLEITAKERDRWRSNYTAAKMDLDMCEKNYELKERQLDLATKKISQIRFNVKSIGININKSRGYIDDIEDALEDINDDLSSLYQRVDDVENETLRDELEGDIEDIQNLINDALMRIITDLRNKMDSMEKKVKEID